MPPTRRVSVCVRVKPELFYDENRLIDCNQSPIVCIDENNIRLSEGKRDFSCSYDKIFPESSSQENLIESVIPLMDSVLQGYNASIFAYGQTGSGKTHTMIGPNGGQVESMSDCGIIPRACSYLFDSIDKMENVKSTILCSYLQIYNENLFDLLQKDSFQNCKKPAMEIRECCRTNKRRSEPNEVYVTGLSQFRVNSAADAIRLLETGNMNRITRSTSANDVSSRSHAILQLLIEIEEEGDGGHCCIRRSKLSFIDLAGSERMQSTIEEKPSDTYTSSSSFNLNDHTKPSQTEALTQTRELIAINLSLTALGNVINILCQNSSGAKCKLFVPYRDSKLTRLMQDSLGGNTNTLLIACISSAPYHVNETLRTLKFADCARKIMSSVRTNIVIDDKVLLARAQSEISRLKLLLASQKCDVDVVTRGDLQNDLNFLIAENSRLKEENSSLRGLIASETSSVNQAQTNNGHDSSPAKKMKKLIHLKQAYNEKRQKPRQHKQQEKQKNVHASSTVELCLPKLIQNNEMKDSLEELTEIRRKKSILQEQLRDLRSIANEPEPSDPVPSFSSLQVNHVIDFSKRDIGMIGELYVFRYDHWQMVHIVDYDKSRKLHCCIYIGDDFNEETHWHNLKLHTFRPMLESLSMSTK